MKLTVSPNIRSYELTYLLPGSFASSEVGEADEAVLKLIKKHKLKLIGQDEWGRMSLAYVIKKAGKKHTEAYYKHLILEGKAAELPKFEANLYLIPQIIRHLLVIANLDESKVSDMTSESAIGDENSNSEKISKVDATVEAR